MGVQNLAQEGSPHLSNLDRILARKTPELQGDTAHTAALGMPQCGNKPKVARICGDVLSMQAREGREPQNRHIEKSRRPTCCSRRERRRIWSHTRRLPAARQKRGLTHVCQSFLFVRQRKPRDVSYFPQHEDRGHWRHVMARGYHANDAMVASPDCQDVGPTAIDVWRIVASTSAAYYLSPHEAVGVVCSTISGFILAALDSGARIRGG
ncbi:hypothetical protein PSPO01_06581 [Paraphaeosphaeria sporulosa]